jgi:tRNA-splicing ligase RtcB (3'-phosphate/5'-hydroxy nucleic acid ligase)
VLIGGRMRTESCILVGAGEYGDLAFCSACHRAGRSMSRTQATKHWQGRKLIDELCEKRVLIRTRSFRGVAEEASGAY